jgi:hypothetical protein
MYIYIYHHYCPSLGLPLYFTIPYPSLGIYIVLHVYVYLEYLIHILFSLSICAFVPSL